ncbi:MAG: GC-type dockerin domain-anchored protein [Phycisphaerales bacterium]
MNAEIRRACLAACGACLFGGTLASAGTVVHDNADLTFRMTPFYYVPAPPYALYGAPSYLFPFSSAADNEAGIGDGISFYIDLGRFGFTSSSIEFDWLVRAFFPSSDLEFALIPTTTSFSNGLQFEKYQPLVQFSPGDQVGPFDFGTRISGVAHGPTAGYSDLGGLVPFLGDEAIIGWRYTDTGGVRYGFLRLTYFEHVEYERDPGFGGGTHAVNLYLPTAWGYAENVDEPALITLPCPADLDGNGALNLDDVNLFANAFVTSDLLADIDGNGTLNLDDVNLFAASFVAGCP